MVDRLAVLCAAWLGGCSPGEGGDPALAPVEVQVEQTEAVATVLRVRWSTPVATTGHVEFGPTAERGLRTSETAEGTEHEALVLGMPADTEVHLRVVATDGEATGASEDLVASTGSLPSQVPTFTATGDPDSWCCYQVLPALGSPYAILVLDTRGEVVWYAFEDRGFGVVHAVLSRDRSAVLYNAEGSFGVDADRPAEESELVRLALDGTPLEPIAWPFLEHDFAELPDGAIAGITTAEHPDNPGEYRGDLVVEVAPDGTRTEVFNVWDWWEDTPEEFGFTHVNALDYSERDDAYLLSVYLMGSVAAVDRATGTPLWALSGDLNEFEFTDGSDGFVHSHQLDRTASGLLVFDNGHDEQPVSRVVEYALDLSTMQAREAWSYTREPSVYSFFFGDVQRLDDEVVRVTWSASGEIQHVDREGEVLWQLDTDLGFALGYGEVVESLYR